MLRTAGPPIERAGACRKARSRSARIRAKVTPAPSVIRAAGGVDARQALVIGAHDGRERDVAFVQCAHHQRAAAEIARVAVGRQRARRPRPSCVKVFTVTGIMLAPCGLLEVPADRLETRLVDIFRDHVGDAVLVLRPRREAGFPVPEGAVAVGHRQQADVGHVVEHRDRRIEQAIAEGLLQIRQRQQLLAQLRAVLQLEAPDTADLVRACARSMWRSRPPDASDRAR